MSEDDRLDELLGALSDRRRRAILDHVMHRGPASASEIGSDVAAATGPISQPSVSRHLKVLCHAGLLERERRGQWAYFRASSLGASLAALALEDLAAAFGRVGGVAPRAVREAAP